MNDTSGGHTGKACGHVACLLERGHACSMNKNEAQEDGERGQDISIMC